MAPPTLQTRLETNRALIRRQHELLGQGDLERTVALFDEGARNHGQPVGRAGVRLVLADIMATFPDVRLDILDLFAEGDWVTVRCTFSGTHLGTARFPHHGGLLVGVPPTSKQFAVQHIHLYRVVDGSIADHFASRDDIEMYQQLGLLPPPASFPAPAGHAGE